MLSTQTTIEAYRDQAIELFCEVFRTMVRLEVYPCPEPASPAPDPVVTSAVYFAGSWKGAALLECNLELAKIFTERLMPGCHPVSFDDDVRDCIGELANMIGGNIKALLPDHAELSIPSVIEGRNYSVRLCGNNSFLRIPFVCEAGTFVIIIVEVATQ
jgi:chemotaxis protein CheX